MTNDGLRSYTWDAEGRMKSVDSGSTRSVTYNALGLAVERISTSPARNFEELFDPAGQELGEFNATTGTFWWDWSNVRAGSRLVAVYWSNAYFLHPNGLGSTGMVTDYSGATPEDETRYPWGQEWSHTGTRYDEHFAGMQWHDYTTGLDPTMFRQYASSYGRWLSPDPAGLAAAHALNPQSWNLYAYVLNNPTNFFDLLGLDCQPGADCVTVTATGGTIATIATGSVGGLNLGGLGDYLGAAGDGRSANPVLIFRPGACGAGGCSGGSTPDVSKTWPATFPCSESATQLMSDVQSDFGQFASNPLGPFIAKFPDEPLQMGRQYDIYAGLFQFNEAGPTYLSDLKVTVTAQTPNAWVFTTDPGHHYFDGTVAFMAADSGNGNVSFSITASANYSSWLYARLGPIIKAGENSTWNNLLGNLQTHCASGSGH